MYSYKLNNSYTMYVNYAYLNECIKASHSCNSSSKEKKKSPVYTMPGIVKNTVKIGSKVSVLDVDTQTKKIFTITCSENINVIEGIISDVSPVGHSLLGHSIGDMITVKVPAGMIRYKIIDLRS